MKSQRARSLLLDLLSFLLKVKVRPVLQEKAWKMACTKKSERVNIKFSMHGHCKSTSAPVAAGNEENEEIGSLRHDCWWEGKIIEYLRFRCKKCGLDPVSLSRHYTAFTVDYRKGIGGYQ